MRFLALPLTVVLLAAAPRTQVAIDPPVHHLVQVLVRDASTLAALQRLDLDLAACSTIELPAKKVDVIATDADIGKLRAAGLEFEVAITNLEAHHARELARFGQAHVQTLTPPLGQGAMGGHYTLAQITAILDSFARDFPGLCSTRVSIGTSHEGRDIWMVKISDNVNVDENEPEVLYDAVHHAREMLSVETMLLFMDELLTNYATDPEARFIVDNRELFFVPVVNPDGHEYNRTTNPGGGGMWRKNRRNNGGGSFGVDLNRNWTTGWNAPNGGNSTDPNSDTYRGPSPMSEPEIQAMDAFIRTRQFVQGFSCHTYTDILLRPWGYQNGDPANAADYNRIGARATARNGLQHGDAATLLYIAAGTALDHYHVAYGMFGWTPEMGLSSEGGFWPNPTQTVAIATRHQHMFRQIALTSGALLGVGAVTVTEAPGGNNNGRVEPGETGRVVAQVSNDGSGNFLGAVQASLVAVSAGITIGTGNVSLGAIPKFSTTSNSTTPLTFSVPANYAGTIVDLRVIVTGDGQTIESPLRIVLGEIRTMVDDDMEANRGFERNPAGTATTGQFERSAPTQTVNGSVVIQPGTDHTPTGTLCWVTDGRGGSAGTYDVDNGWTEVISPTLDLQHLALARLTCWRWYAESVQDDPFQIFVSNDGGFAWSQLLDDRFSTGAWVPFTAEIPVPLTATMVFRFRAQDLNPSLVEALIDDLTIEGIAPEASLTLLSSGRIGTTARLGMSGRGVTVAVPLVAGAVGNLAIPGISGNLLLDPASLVVLASQALPSGGYAGLDLPIPGVASLVGSTLHFQLLQVANLNDLRLGNRQTLRLR